MNKKILSDHKKEGKILKPPMMTNINLIDLSWVDYIIPDIIWISLLRETYGEINGTEIVNKFIKIVSNHETKEFKIYSFISSFERMPIENKKAIVAELKKENLLSPVLYSLKDFLDMYPNCPLNFLQEDTYTQKVVNIEFLVKYKRLLAELMDKRSRVSTLTIANIFYSLSILKRLHIVKGSPLDKLPEIQDYPNTEISRLIGSSLRASINAFYNLDKFEKESSWANQFWNRGIELENCLI